MILDYSRYYWLREGAEEGDNSQETENNNAGNNAANNSDTKEDNNSNDNKNNSMDLPDEDDNGNENGNDNKGGGEEDNGEEDLFGDDEEGGDSGDSDSNSDDDSSMDEEPDENDIVRQSEEEMFANLTQAEIDMKHTELKNNFINLYTDTEKIIERVNDIKTSGSSIAIAEYISVTIYNLRDLIYDYMTKLFDRKSYTESAILFNRYLAVLKGIEKLLDTIIENEGKEENN